MHNRDSSVNPTPHPLPLTGRSNERYEFVGEGYEDQYGNPTKDGFFYKLVDHEPSGVFGVIVAGPFRFPPREEPDAEGDDALFLAAVADAIGRVGHDRAGTIASALATHAQVAAHHGRTSLANQLHDLVRDVMARALYHDRHPAPPASFQVIELASSERV